MDQQLREKINSFVDDKLTTEQKRDLENFFIKALSVNLGNSEEDFFKNMTYEMTGQLKELAMLIIDFRKDIKSKINPEITDLAIKHIPEAADQLEGIIETTEKAANKVMDNLEAMQGQAGEMENAVKALKNGGFILPGGGGKISLEQGMVEMLNPLFAHVESGIESNKSLISDCFVQMSFQDLTGQRIRKIMALVGQMEAKLKNMIIAFGIKLSEKEKNPDITEEELQKAVDDRVTELAGPQRQGQGLNQADIDDILAAL